MSASLHSERANVSTPADSTHKFTIAVHDAANIFPMLSDDELGEMAKSITFHGLREKIQAIPVVHDDRTDWIVVDGRNRLEALRRLGMDDARIVNEFFSPINLGKMNATVEEYIVMANIERRNLTQPQRKALAGKLAIMLAEAQKDKPKEEQVDTLDKAAKAAGVSRRTAATAKKEVASGAARKPAPKKKKPAAKALPAPAVVSESLRKAIASAKKYGHNWPAQTGFEVYNAALELAAALATKDNIANEAEKKLGTTWNAPIFELSQRKKDEAMMKTDPPKSA